MTRPSWFRITTRTLFLAAALFLGLTFYYLPNFLQLDEFRPQITAELEKTFGCKAIVGDVTLELVPSPGLVVTHVVLLREGPPMRVLASVTAVHLWLSPKSMMGHLRFRAIRFWKPRFIVHGDWGPNDERKWTLIALPHAPRVSPDQNAATAAFIDEWDVRMGNIEVWDHTTSPTTKWIADQFSGSFSTVKQTGALAGKPVFLGRQARIDLHYDGKANFPFQGQFLFVNLASLQKVLHTHLPALDGLAESQINLRLEPNLAIEGTLSPVYLRKLNEARIRGRMFYEHGNLRIQLRTLAVSPMTTLVRAIVRRHAWKIRALVTGYDAAIVRGIYHQSWVDRLEGRGMVSAEVESSTTAPHWSAEGKNFTLSGSSWSVPQWTVHGDENGLAVHVTANTAPAGSALVIWSLPPHSTDASLQVQASSVTLHQVFDVFQSTATLGCNSWMIHQGQMQALIHDGSSLDVQKGDFWLEGMHLLATGHFGLSLQGAAHIEGELANAPVEQIVTDFTRGPSPITGTGAASFVLDFPLTRRWIEGLNGLVTLEIDQGVLHMLKTAYRIVSVLNLTNYLRLRLPHVSAQGILFQTIKGHVTFQNGLLKSDDLFLKSPDMNIGAKGVVNIPGQRLDCRLRIEMFRFLEDVLRYVPITHWIFKKPNKIFLPLVVDVQGPWDNPDIH